MRKFLVIWMKVGTGRWMRLNANASFSLWPQRTLSTVSPSRSGRITQLESKWWPACFKSSAKRFISSWISSDRSLEQSWARNSYQNKDTFMDEWISSRVEQSVTYEKCSIDHSPCHSWLSLFSEVFQSMKTNIVCLLIVSDGCIGVREENRGRNHIGFVMRKKRCHSIVEISR